jgi:hypothetical protein
VGQKLTRHGAADHVTENFMKIPKYRRAKRTSLLRRFLARKEAPNMPRKSTIEPGYGDLRWVIKVLRVMELDGERHSRPSLEGKALEGEQRTPTRTNDPGAQGNG